MKRCWRRIKWFVYLTFALQVLIAPGVLADIPRDVSNALNAPTEAARNAALINLAIANANNIANFRKVAGLVSTRVPPATAVSAAGALAAACRVTPAKGPITSSVMSAFVNAYPSFSGDIFVAVVAEGCSTKIAANVITGVLRTASGDLVANRYHVFSRRSQITNDFGLYSYVLVRNLSERNLIFMEAILAGSGSVRSSSINWKRLSVFLFPVTKDGLQYYRKYNSITRAKLEKFYDLDYSRDLLDITCANIGKRTKIRNCQSRGPYLVVSVFPDTEKAFTDDRIIIDLSRFRRDVFKQIVHDIKFGLLKSGKGGARTHTKHAFANLVYIFANYFKVVRGQLPSLIALLFGKSKS